MDRVAICNMALGFFGQSPIVSIEENDLNSDEARLCATYLDPCIRVALEDAAPLFATDLIDLGARQDSAYAALPAKFALPSTIIRPLRFDDGSGKFTIKAQRSKMFVISEDTDKLLCEAVLFTDDLKDPNAWTANFQFAVAYNLASVICGPITHSAAIKKEMLAEYEVFFKKADNLDGMASTTNQQISMSSTSLANRRF